MYEQDQFGRVWLDDKSFLAPFGYFSKDYDYVINYLRDPVIAKRTFFEGFDEPTLLQIYGGYLKTGFGWIGFYEKQRAGFLILDVISKHPLIYAVHGGVDKKLFGKDYGVKSMDFVKHFAFEKMSGTKLEGYEFKKNSFVTGYFKRGGLTKECEIPNRILIDGTLNPMSIYGLTKDAYVENKEKADGIRRQSTKTTRPDDCDKSATKGARRSKAKIGKRKKRKRR